MDASIQFHKADVRFRLLKQNELRMWLVSVAKKEGFKVESINVILCSDEYLYQMNVSYLKHKTYTDIITFDYSQRSSPLSGELYISIERVIDNADNLGIKASEELHRVMVHGVLHLCGYGDKTASDKALMRKKEDFYLSLRKFI
jgi:probable rRNA maturation factor